MEKIPPISLKLNFTTNTLGCYGLGYHISDSAFFPYGKKEHIATVEIADKHVEVLP